MLTDPVNLYESRGRPRTPLREAVEAALKTATIARPLTTEQIAALAGARLSLTRQTVRNIVAYGYAHRVDESRYAWGPVPRPAPAVIERQTPKPGSYSGAELRAFTARPTSNPPSLQNGRRVAHRAPLSLATPATKEWGI